MDEQEQPNAPGARHVTLKQLEQSAAEQKSSGVEVRAAAARAIANLAKNFHKPAAAQALSDALKPAVGAHKRTTDMASSIARQQALVDQSPMDVAAVVSPAQREAESRKRQEALAQANLETQRSIVASLDAGANTARWTLWLTAATLLIAIIAVVAVIIVA
jgi:hypothetical protein